MQILIDIIHPADINFYKNSVEELIRLGHKITFTVLRRGNIPEIMKKEYSSSEIILLGKHRSSFIGKLWSIFTRELGFFKLYATRKFDVVTGFGFYTGVLAWLFGIKSVHFHDDKEYKMNFLLTKLFSSKFISLCPTKKSKKTKIVNSYKELAYLYPRRIKEDTKFFKKLGIQKEKYIYVRDVANISLNYSSNKLVDYTLLLDYTTKKGYKIVYQPEININPYKNVTLLKKKSYSGAEMTAIKKYAALVVTSGDTVLREAALMGTPTIYTSSRSMNINKNLKKAGLFETAATPKELLKKGKQLLMKGVKAKHKTLANKEISKRADMNSIIIRELTT